MESRRRTDSPSRRGTDAPAARSQRTRTSQPRAAGQRASRPVQGQRSSSRAASGPRQQHRSSRNGGLGASWAADRASSASWPVAVAAPIAGIAIVIVVALALIGGIRSCAVSQPDQVESAAAESSEQESQIVSAYESSFQQIDALADPGTTVQAASLGSDVSPEGVSMSSAGATQVQSALSAVMASGNSVGFAFFDLETGKGYTYNLDQRVYGASSFKAPVLIYGCQQAIDTGRVSIADVASDVERAIVSSDNDSYYRMRERFENSATASLGSWLTSLGVSDSLASDTRFPHCSARESLKLWMNTYLYLSSADSNQETTAWVESLLSETEVSMIRNGLDPVSNPINSERVHSVSQELQGALLGKLKTVEVGTAKNVPRSETAPTVYDKAGWIAGTDDDGVCDAGIVQENGKSYLLTIMTNQADSVDSRSKVSALASALWGQRSTLA